MIDATFFDGRSTRPTPVRVGIQGGQMVVAEPGQSPRLHRRDDSIGETVSAPRDSEHVKTDRRKHQVGVELRELGMIVELVV